MKYRGLVIKELVAVGSKSEHEAVMLEMNGDRLELRRMGANPFHDTMLDQLVGKDVEIEGYIYNGKLIVTSWGIVV